MDNPKKIVLGMVLIAMIPSAITFEAFSPHRAMLSFSTLSIISAFGLYWFLKGVRELKVIYNVKILIFAFTFITLFINVIYFFRIYTISYPYEKSLYLQYPFKQIAQFAWSQYQNFDQIIFDPKFGETAPMVGVGAHYYLAYFGNYPPEKFQKQYWVNDQGLFFDKFSIRNVIWAKDKDLKNALLIVSPWSVPEKDLTGYQIMKRFSFYNGQLAFYAIKL